MGVKAMTWAFEAPIYNASAKFVLVALADHASDHAGEDWACFPSIERLAAFTGQSEKTVRRALNWLEGEGWISRERRRGNGGWLGVYDYILHRDGAAPAADAEAESEVDEAGQPAVNLTGGPAVNLSSTSGQIGHAPPVKLTGLNEPSLEPSGEPSTGARARGAWREQAKRLAGEVWRLWPADDRKASSEQLVCEAVEVALGRGADPAAMLIGVKACLADRSARGASGRLIAPHRFIGEGRWKTFAELPPGGKGGALDARRALFADDVVRAAFVARFGETAAVSWLDRCAWDAERRRLHPRNGTARDWWSRSAGGWLAEQAIVLGEVRKAEVGDGNGDAG